MRYTAKESRTGTFLGKADILCNVAGMMSEAKDSYHEIRFYVWKSLLEND